VKQNMSLQNLVLSFEDKIICWKSLELNMCTCKEVKTQPSNLCEIC
jgi:hypothetical protein